jgi:hypothetical protein
MTHISVTDFSDMSAPKLRLAETKHLFELFKTARNVEPNYGLFLLTTYFDSLLFCLISIEEMTDAETRSKLRSLESFLFFKALRNIATHHSVLSAIRGKFERPIARIVSVGIGAPVEFSEQFFLVPDRLERIFDSILLERPGEGRTIESARRYLSTLKARGGQIMVVDLVQGVINDIEPHVA